MEFSEKFVNPSPESQANPISKLFFWWLKSLFRPDGSKNLGIKDLYNVLPENSSQRLGDKLEEAWNRELEITNYFNPKPNCKVRDPSLFLVSCEIFGSLFWYYGIHVFIICVILRGLLPYVLGLLIWHFDPRSNSTTEQGYMYASLLVIMIILQAAIGHHSVVGRKIVGMKLAVAYSSLVYRKILRLSITASNQYNVGKIINLLSSDMAKFEDVCMFWHYIWVLPIQGLLFLAFFIWNKIGVALLAGILFLTIQTVPIQGYLAKKTGELRGEVASRTDERVRLMSEIVNGIRVIKMYVWEKPFEKLVFLARRHEIDAIASKSYLRGLSVATSAFAENTSMFFMILTYVLSGNVLEASIVYSVAQYFGMIKIMITVFYPRAKSSSAEARVAIERIQEDNTEVRVIESDSLWERLRTACWKPPYIIGGVIAALMIGVVITLAVVLTMGNSSNTPGELAIDYSKALIVSDERDLWALDLNSQEKTVLVKTSQGIAAFDIYKKKTIYWHEAGSTWVNSLSKKYYNLTQSREWEPRAIAVDYVTENVYVLDGLAGKVNVYDPTSTKLGIVVSDLKNPSDIALDPVKGLMFIVQHSHSIIKGNMDGTSLEKIISSPGVTSVAVDTQTPRLYWSDSASIASSDYSGHDYRIVTPISGSTLSLGVSGNRLFWTRPPSGPGSFRTLWSATSTGEDVKEITFQDPKMIKVYTGEGPLVENPCGQNKGECEQMCLLTSSSGKSCSCYLGYRLKEDGKSCEKVDDYILYAKGDFIRGRILDSDKQAFSDAILPVRIQLTPVSDKRTIDFDYNYYTNTFAFSDDRSISTVDLLRNDSQGAYSQVGEKCLKDVSFDWVTNDIYYIKDNCHTADNTAIIVLKPKENQSFRRTLKTFDFRAGQLRSLAVHPHRGIYFFTVLLKADVQIYRARDSKIMPFFEEKFDVNETGLAIDYVEDRLYWFSRNTTTLYNANLDGTDVKNIDVSMVLEPRSVGIYDRYAYVANLTTIWRLDKLTGYGPVKLAPRLDDDVNALIAGVRIFSSKVQLANPNNPCTIQNGDCEQFCFLTPRVVASGPNSVNVTNDLKKICLCEDYKMIQGDARSCADFLLLDEVESRNDIKKADESDTPSIILKNLFVSWKGKSRRSLSSKTNFKNILHNINLDISDNKLYVIAGPVGTGKSTLLKTILGELQPDYNSRSIQINGSISYVSQEPWLFPGLVRSNILFCETFDEERYARVVNACALNKDFELLPDGDKTYVGDRGTTLSGGQRARVNLARALYREADIYLIDDVLTAVDVHVGKYIFDKCVNDLLKGKIRILITNNSQYFKEADEIIILNNGTIEFDGSYEKLIESEYSLPELPANPLTTAVNESSSKNENVTPNELKFMFTKRKATKAQSNEDEEFVVKGHKEKSVYWRYFRAGGSVFKLLFLALSLILAQISISGCDYWLAYWIKEEENLVKIHTDEDKRVSLDFKGSLWVFGSLLLCSIVMWTTSSLLFYRICMNASKNLHNRMFSCLIKAPMRFFELNPSGTILNRFSKDTGLMDETLPTVTLDGLQVLLMIAGVAIQVAIINWWSILPMIITAVVCWEFKNIYLPTAQTIRRLESKAKSPVFSHVNSTVSGLITIRSSKAQKTLLDEFDSLQDVHTSAHYLNIISSSAFGFWLDIVSVVLLAFVSFSFLLIKKDETFAGIVGLAITQILLLYGKVQYGLRQTTEMMTQMISVERIFQFTNLEQEGPIMTEFEKMNSLKDWPDKGEIKFDHVYLKYSDDEEPVLKDITLNIKSHEKIGIVGRTGAGKTSLVSVLFRLVNPEGSLYIDEVDIKSIGLHDLRSRISIIPQDPILFTTTVRNNLDPLYKYDNEILWQALDEVDLKSQFQSLDYLLENKGNNLSTGQKQLLCLARAIITNNKILILDEATAHVDPVTDEIIKKTIKRRFSKCTVLTVAHRLNTVLNSDRIIVMDEGRVVEFDNSENLNKKANGYFSLLMSSE